MLTSDMTIAEKGLEEAMRIMSSRFLIRILMLFFHG